MTSADEILEALDHLRRARARLVSAGAVRVAEKVRLTIKSTEGAYRHARRHDIAAQRARLKTLQRFGAA